MVSFILLCSRSLGRGIKWWCCLTSVCLSVAYTGPKSRTRTPRPRKTKIGTGVSHVTPDSSITFKVKKGQGHQAALFTAMLARQAAAAVGVGICWPWETADTLPSARQLKALRRPRERRGAGAYRGGRLPTACTNVDYGCSGTIYFTTVHIILHEAKNTTVERLSFDRWQNMMWNEVK